MQRDAKTGVQRVTRSILRELLVNPPSKYSVEPVYAVLGQSGYRYAKRFTKRFLAQPDSDQIDELIEAGVGDIFLGLDLQHHVVLAQEEYLAKLRRNGVKVHFVVYDLLPVLMPENFPAGAAVGHHSWLKVISQYDGVICISKAVADEMSCWMEREHRDRLRRLEIAWFHLGADFSETASPEVPGNVNSPSTQCKAGPNLTKEVGPQPEPRSGFAGIISVEGSPWLDFALNSGQESRRENSPSGQRQSLHRVGRSWP